MPSSVYDYSNAQRLIVSSAKASLVTFFRRLDYRNARSVRDNLLEAVPPLALTHGNASAALSAQWFNYLREQSGANKPYSAIPYLVGPDLDVIPTRIYYDVDSLFGPDPDPNKALAELGDTLDEIILNAGRQTMISATNHDPNGPTWVRVPSGEACSFCITVAGASYTSSATARYTDPDELEKFHPNCNCQVVARWNNDSLGRAGVVRSDMDRFEQLYQAAAEQAESTDIRKVTAAMRSQNEWLKH